MKAVQRVKEAVAEITAAARKDPLLGAEGAVLFFEKVSPALEQVDSSSGAINNTAINNTALPLDLNTFKYVQVSQAAEIPGKLTPEIKAILEEAGAALEA